MQNKKIELMISKIPTFKKLFSKSSVSSPTNVMKQTRNSPISVSNISNFIKVSQPEPAQLLSNFKEEEPIVVVLKKEKAKESKPYDLDSNLSLTLKTQRKVIKLSSKHKQTIPILVNVKTEELTEEQEGERAPIDLVCVIDISGSM